MNYRIIIHIISFLLLITGLFMLTSIPFSVYYGDDDINALLLSGIITSVPGLIIWLLTKKSSNEELHRREGYITVTLGWIMMSAFGALPFMLHGSIPSYTDAFFETMSGFTTTGASILTDIESMPHGLLYWRSLTQWLGGMGIIVLSLAILPILGIGGMQLFIAEVPGPTKDKIHPRVQETAKRLWGIYVVLTFAEMLLLYAGGMTVFDAINHSFTTMATGGFSTKNANIVFYTSPFIQYTLTLFMFLAGVNFTLHYYALHLKFEFLRQNNEFRFYTVFILASTIIITLLHIPLSAFGLEELFRLTLFHVVSLVTTTGYVASDYDSWAPFSRIFFFLLLFIGGCAGSTGGGIKIARHFLLWKNSVLELKRLVHPRAVIPVRINGRAVPPEILTNVLAFFLFYILLFIAGSIILSYFGLDFDSALGAVATCLGNVGPGIGTVGPIYNFGHVSDAGKWILSFFMLVGRLELFTVLIIFSPSFWKT